MLQVSSPRRFASEHFINGFSGKNYEEAIKAAEEWATREKKELVAYFCQKAFGKSILVSYRVVHNESDAG